MHKQSFVGPKLGRSTFFTLRPNLHNDYTDYGLENRQPGADRHTTAQHYFSFVLVGVTWHCEKLHVIVLKSAKFFDDLLWNIIILLFICDRLLNKLTKLTKMLYLEDYLESKFPFFRKWWRNPYSLLAVGSSDALAKVARVIWK